MHVAVVTVVRNAIDALDDFLAHHLVIANRIHVVDHLSDDGTYELLAARAEQDPRIVLATFDFKQFFQGAVMTALAKQAVAHGADWVLPLDVDEFLPYRSAEELQLALAGSGSQLVRFEWLNCVAQALPTENGPMDWSVPFLSLPSEPASTKVAIASNLVALRDFRVSHGAHNIELKTRESLNGRLVGRLLHFPIRSVEQAREKYRLNGESHLAMNRRTPKLSKHYFVMADAFKGNYCVEEIQSLALLYPRRGDAGIVDHAELVSFRPNRRFPDRPELAPPTLRNPRHSPLRQEEICAAIRGGEVVLRAIPLWRTRRLLHVSRAFVLRLRAWILVRLRSD